jgi:2,4-dienoyl-CoA reductase-like NADH-dependent reductase (Old Yellow Enzyme family)
MSLLFSPYSVNKMEVKNRFVHSATQECMAGDNGEITDELIKRYVNLAKGETGLYPRRHVRGSSGQVSPSSDRCSLR